MKKPTLGQDQIRRPAARIERARKTPAKIHPVVIYPFRQPDDYGDLEQLYTLVARLAGDPARYARPITVMDRKTSAAAERDRRFRKFRDQTVGRVSDVLDVWSADTCQMWYDGLGLAADRGGADDVYWLIPGDFNYGTPVGREVLGRIHDLPEIVLELRQDLCVGEIETNHSNPKYLIDTYGTFALLYTWFPEAAREIREFTERPRSEFFAVHHSFLHDVMRQRWFAYEQTVVMLLRAVFGGKRISRFFVGSISDLPEGRETLDSAMQQVERTERVLKMVWRERHRTDRDWIVQYHDLEAHSEQVRRTALLLLHNLLGA